MRRSRRLVILFENQRINILYMLNFPVFFPFVSLKHNFIHYFISQRFRMRISIWLISYGTMNIEEINILYQSPLWIGLIEFVSRYTRYSDVIRKIKLASLFFLYVQSCLHHTVLTGSESSAIRVSLRRILIHSEWFLWSERSSNADHGMPAGIGTYT